jgi:hypothetical protein
MGQGYMTVKSGKPCTFDFKSSGPTVTVEIMQRPANGNLSLGSIGKVTYRSRAGFVGKDEITYQRRGFDLHNNPALRPAHISVTVE